MIIIWPDGNGKDNIKLGVCGKPEAYSMQGRFSLKRDDQMVGTFCWNCPDNPDFKNRWAWLGVNPIFKVDATDGNKTGAIGDMVLTVDSNDNEE